MNKTVKERPKDIRIEDGGVTIKQTESGDFIVYTGPSVGLFAIVLNTMELEALVRICLSMKREIEGAEK